MYSLKCRFYATTKNIALFVPTEYNRFQELKHFAILTLSNLCLEKTYRLRIKDEIFVAQICYLQKLNEYRDDKYPGVLETK